MVFFILATLVLLLTIAGIFWWRMQLKSKKEEPVSSELPVTIGTVDGEEDIVRMVARLLAHPVALVDVHHLDQLLGIAELESLDYRRVRRSRYIKAVNQYYQAQEGKELIIRTKSEVDKRIILYRISP
jgi:tRNA isopentenyl-2-thiomethyl-A-37 hydroxylase MiaE